MTCRLPLLVAVTVLLAAASAAAPQDNDALSFARARGGWRPAWFLCPAASATYVVGLPAADRTITVHRPLAPAPAATRLHLGRGEPGMSQIHYLLTDARGRDAGFLHAVSPAVYEGEAALPSFTEVRLDGATRRCRFDPATVLLVVTGRRTITISRAHDETLAYAASTRPDGTPDLRLAGGHLSASPHSDMFMFANGRYRYRLQASRDPARPGATLTVLRDGRTILREPAFAYSIAAAPPARSGA